MKCVGYRESSQEAARVLERAVLSVLSYNGQPLRPQWPAGSGRQYLPDGRRVVSLQRPELIAQRDELQPIPGLDFNPPKYGFTPVMPPELARRALAGAPWYARSIMPQLHSSEFLRTLYAWDGRAVVTAMSRQQKAFCKCRETLKLVLDLVRDSSGAAVSARTVDDFENELWADVAKRLDVNCERSVLTRALGLPGDLVDKLAAVNAKTADREEDGADDHALDSIIEYLLDSQDSGLSIEEERLQKLYDDALFGVAENVKAMVGKYEPAVKSVVENPQIGMPGSSSLSVGPSTRTLANFVVHISGTADGGASVNLPEAQCATVGAVDTPRRASGSPVSHVLPNALQGWTNQVRMMEHLGRPEDEQSARARVEALASQMKKIEALCSQRLKALQASDAILRALKEALNDRQWSTKRCDLRWYRACLVSKLNQLMNSAQVGAVVKKVMGGALCLSPGVLQSRPVDYEYLRFLKEARLEDKAQAPDLVYRWLTTNKEEARYAVFVNGRGSMIAADDVSITKKCLDSVGLTKHIVTGDCESPVEPIAMSPEAADWICETVNRPKLVTPSSTLPTIQHTLEPHKDIDLDDADATAAPSPWDTPMTDAERAKVLSAYKNSRRD